MKEIIYLRMGSQSLVKTRFHAINDPAFSRDEQCYARITAFQENVLPRCRWEMYRPSCSYMYPLLDSAEHPM
jgi:hypothetical protein